MRRWYVWMTISIVLLALLLWRTQPWEALSTGADWRILVGVVLLNAVVIGGWAIRSERLMAAVGHPLPLASLVPIVSLANTVNNLTPASSGEALRAIILRRRHDVGYDHSTAVILAERVWAIWIMAVTAGAAAVGTVVAAPAPVVAAAWILAAIACFAPSVAYRLGLRPAAVVARWIDRGAFSAAAPRVGDGRSTPAPPGDASAAPRLGRRARLARLLRAVDTNLAGIVARPTVALGFVLSTAVIFATFTGQLWLVLASLGENVAPAAVWAALGLGTIAGVISALPFGLGAADVVMTALLVSSGVPPSAAAASALLLRATVTLPLGLAGTASWIVLSREPGPASAETGEP